MQTDAQNLVQILGHVQGKQEICGLYKEYTMLRK